MALSAFAEDGLPLLTTASGTLAPLTARVRATALAGVTEGDETSTLRSHQSQPRRLRAEQARPPRPRGGNAAKRSFSDEEVQALVLRDRFGHTADYVLAHDEACHIAPPS